MTSLYIAVCRTKRVKMRLGKEHEVVEVRALRNFFELCGVETIEIVDAHNPANAELVQYNWIINI